MKLSILRPSMAPRRLGCSRVPRKVVRALRPESRGAASARRCMCPYISASPTSPASEHTARKNPLSSLRALPAAEAGAGHEPGPAYVRPGLKPLGTAGGWAERAQLAGGAEIQQHVIRPAGGAEKARLVVAYGQGHGQPARRLAQQGLAADRFGKHVRR